MTAFPRMHISLYVSDLEKTIQFYTSFFGQAPDKIKPRYTKFTLEEPSLIISFIENKDRVQAHFGHLGFQVETKEILQARLNDLKAKQLVTLEEEQTACCYAVQDKFWVSDPDGTQWEVYYFHADVEFNDPHYQLENEEKKVAAVTAEIPSDLCAAHCECC